MRGRQGSALVMVLVAMVAVGLCLTLTHRMALDLLRRGRSAMAILRAREAAASGLESYAVLGMSTGVLPGGAWWVVSRPTQQGERSTIRAHGFSGGAPPATHELVASLSTGESRPGGAGLLDRPVPRITVRR